MLKKHVQIICCMLAALLTLNAAFLFLFARPVLAAVPSNREETVYVDMDGDGNITSIISSVYLSNPWEADSLTDYTSLTDIKNIAGMESPSIDGDSVTFPTEGEDVIYQGNASAQSLPFAIQISYTLDGRPVDAAELAGASGRVTIQVKAENKQKQQVDVEGEEVSLYTPFTIICMYTLGKSFTNIATSGKLTNQAGEATVLGILQPGLSESLGDLENDNLTDTLTIEADAQNLELSGATIVAMVGLLDEDDLSGIENVQDLVEGLEDLNSATKEFRNGARELYDGAVEFTEGAIDLADGTRQIADGAREAADGSLELADGIGEIYKGIVTLYENLREAMAGGGTTATGGNASAGYLSTEDVQMIAAALYAAAAQGSLSQTQVAGILARLQNTGSALTEAQDMQKQLSTLLKGIETLKNGLKELQQGSVEMAVGLDGLASGTDELDAGAFELADGAIELTDGIKELADGAAELHRDGTSKLVDETSSIGVSLSRKDALLDLADSYNAFSATRPVKNGNVQFLLTVQAIQPELPIEEESMETMGAMEVEMEAEKVSWVEKIANWFKGLFQ